MEKKRFLAGAVSIALALTLVSTSAFAASVEFTDVPSSHWASASISEMAEQGIMSGVGNNKFAPDTTLTGSQFVTMIVRHFYEDKLGDGGDKWYSAFMDVAEKEGILVDTSITAEGVINRYDMAQLMYNVLKAENISTTPLSDTSRVGDWSSIPNTYQDAVSVCYNMGMLSGVDSKGTFNGNGQMTRAQAAVVMDRLLEVCSDGTPTTPEVPKVPTDATHITTIEQLTGWQGFSVSNGVFHSDGTGSAGSVSRMRIDPSGYDTITFTVQALDRDVQVSVAHRDKGLPYFEVGETEILGVVVAGTSQSFTVGCSTYETFTIQPGDYQWLVDEDFRWGEISNVLVECYISDIYLY